MNNLSDHTPGGPASAASSAGIDCPPIARLRPPVITEPGRELRGAAIVARYRRRRLPLIAPLGLPANTGLSAISGDVHPGSGSVDGKHVVCCKALRQLAPGADGAAGERGMTRDRKLHE